MTIKELMNMMNVCSDVNIEVFSTDLFEFRHCYYSGKYEECSKHIQNLYVVNFIVKEVDYNEFDELYIVKVTIYITTDQEML